MFEYLDSYQLELAEWLLLILCAILIGMAKTGVSGAGFVVVPILVTIFGGKPSTGFLLPMLSMADLFAVKYYNRHAEWKHVLRLLPLAVVGIIVALIIGKYVSDKVFKQLIALSIFIGIGLMVWRDFRKKPLKIPNYKINSKFFGFLGGFATMIGNAAGPIMSVYLLTMRLPKNNFVGTKAWFFMIINLFKIPLHIIFWSTISWNSFKFNLTLLPAIALGAIAGVKIVRLIPENYYRLLIIVTTIISAFIMLYD